MEDIALKPVGFVENSVTEHRFSGFAEDVSEIAVDEQFSEALAGIEDYSHVIIVYWMDQVRGHAITHPHQGNPDVPEVGIFACRCPKRPNPIAITTVLP